MKEACFYIGDTGNKSDPSELKTSSASAKIEIYNQLMAKCRTW